MPVEVLDHELQDMYQTALQVAKKAGQMIRDTFHQDKKVDVKNLSFADLVTETDIAIEKEVHILISNKFPNHKFIGEETVAASGGQCEFTDDPTWIIDPIDGTTNFVHKIQEVSFSLAITVNKEPVIGVVYIPVKEELFTSRAGQGAFLNDQPLKVSGAEELKSSVVITESGSSRDKDVVAFKIKNIHTLVTNCAGIRAYGSAALNLCHLAAGRGDAFYEFGIHIWDFAAGALIAKEAGATVLDTSGAELDLMKRRILGASSPQLAKAIYTLLQQRDMGSDWSEGLIGQKV